MTEYTMNFYRNQTTTQLSLSVFPCIALYSHVTKEMRKKMSLFFPTRNLMARWRFQIASSLHAAKSRLKSQPKLQQKSPV